MEKLFLTTISVMDADARTTIRFVSVRILPVGNIVALVLTTGADHSKIDGWEVGRHWQQYRNNRW